MKDLTFGTLIAVFEEVFGRWLFWGMVAAAVLVTLAYLYVLVRDRSINWRKFLLAQISMPVGAVLAVWFVMAVTHSKLTDLGGPIDVIVFLGIAVAGAIGIAILVYTGQSLIAPPSPSEGRRKSNDVPSSADLRAPEGRLIGGEGAVRGAEVALQLHGVSGGERHHPLEPQRRRLARHARR